MKIYQITLDDGQINHIVATDEYIQENFPSAILIKEDTPLIEDAPFIASKEITRRQGLLVLYEAKQITENDIQNLIDQIPDEAEKYKAHVEFHASRWEMNSPVIQAFAAQLQITQEDLQELFNQAALL